MPIRILLADDHEVVREGFKSILERQGYEVVGEAPDGHEAVRLAEKLKPQLAILDLAMPLLNGIEATRQILRVSPQTKTILLTMYKEDQYVLEALRAGVAGYVLKTKAAKDLVQAIRQVSKGIAYLSPEVSQTLVDVYRSGGQILSEPLTARERQVLQLVAEGKTTKEVASLLDVSVKTAETHRTNLMKKLDIHETAGLVRYAIRTGLIHP
ncbi:MAG TPA: response regulator transcription factor [Terriglobia bacterium]|nr:response regulator transcription factor [Terriglobia bacterium]